MPTPSGADGGQPAAGDPPDGGKPKNHARWTVNETSILFNTFKAQVHCPGCSADGTVCLASQDQKQYECSNCSKNIDWKDIRGYIGTHLCQSHVFPAPGKSDEVAMVVDDPADPATREQAALAAASPAPDVPAPTSTAPSSKKSRSSRRTSITPSGFKNSKKLQIEAPAFIAELKGLDLFDGTVLPDPSAKDAEKASWVAYSSQLACYMISRGSKLAATRNRLVETIEAYDGAQRAELCRLQKLNDALAAGLSDRAASPAYSTIAAQSTSTTGKSTPPKLASLPPSAAAAKPYVIRSADAPNDTGVSAPAFPKRVLSQVQLAHFAGAQRMPIADANATLIATGMSKESRLHLDFLGDDILEVACTSATLDRLVKTEAEAGLTYRPQFDLLADQVRSERGLQSPLDRRRSLLKGALRRLAKNARASRVPEVRDLYAGLVAEALTRLRALGVPESDLSELQQPRPRPGTKTGSDVSPDANASATAQASAGSSSARSSTAASATPGGPNDKTTGKPTTGTSAARASTYNGIKNVDMTDARRAYSQIAKLRGQALMDHLQTHRAPEELVKLQSKGLIRYDLNDAAYLVKLEDLSEEAEAGLQDVFMMDVDVPEPPAQGERRRSRTRSAQHALGDAS